MQDLIGHVVTSERQRITQLLDKAITPEIVAQLERMLQAEEGVYRINVLKHEPKDFSNKELRQEVARRNFFQPLYEFAQIFLSTAELSAESIKYYASTSPILYGLQTQAHADECHAIVFTVLCFPSIPTD